ncbi:MAG: PRC-barrel domain-containing protein [Flavobacteriaceae bacterium]|nr:PRC-barrel domain-containing protein [Flavobacteriaceae bacterium]
MEKDKKHLYNLDELSDYKVASGYNNVKGWSVKDRDNRVIGKVDDLLVNLESERVVYLDVKVDDTIIEAGHDPYRNPSNPNVREFVNKDGENHIIIPIGLIDINSDQHYVYTDSINHRTFAETPRYRNGDPIDREYEVAVLDSYNRDSTNLDEDKVREIVREEVHNKKSELQNEPKIRKIVRDEVQELEGSTKTAAMYQEVRDETLAEQRARLQRNEYVESKRQEQYDTSASHAKKGLDFDHDNDGNPNITDPDYYQKKARDIKNADYDHDNDGNPNITDPDYYEKKGRELRNKDYDHDNDGNPNITDPDYYDKKTPRKPDSDYKGFYDRDEFNDRHLHRD